jgi:DNA-binding NarL/FixJ family response regulator
MGTGSHVVSCVLLADRHHGLAEGVRGLLETAFDAVVMVADQTSLFESADRLKPTLAVVDLSLARDESLEWLPRLRARCPDLKLIVLSVHDEPTVRQAALAAGADGFVLKRAISTELMPTVDAVLAGRRVEPGTPSNGSVPPK